MSRPIEDALNQDLDILETIKVNAEALDEDDNIDRILIENGIDPTFPTWGVENGDANE